ncbi:hypothetical protein ABH931_003150 [Streptacidiphilus sp. MAP12-33]|uniref:hypothetical protein n=1 Tax=Streptacidiphilus sp. MAP12-33 TaxID=3156266 RepID=UPI003510E201
MDTTTYRIPRAQRRKFLRWGLGLWLPALACLAAVHWPIGRVGLAFFVVLALVVDLTYLNIALGRTLVSAHGIASLRPLARRSWRWNEIASVEVDVATYSKGAPISHVAVRTTGGRKRRLAVPYSTDGLADDTFQQTADDIIAAWRSRRRAY